MSVTVIKTYYINTSINYQQNTLNKKVGLSTVSQSQLSIRITRNFINMEQGNDTR